jgi:hypothetical protein
MIGRNNYQRINTLTMDKRENNADRRGYFRLQDKITLEYEKLGEYCTETDPYSIHLGVSPHLKLLSELHKIENESSHLLHTITEHNRAVGHYLKALNKRIDHISKFIATDQFTLPPHPTHDVSLSEGGVAFETEEDVKLGEMLHVKLVLFPSLTNIAAIGRATYCQQQGSTPGGQHYRIGIEFEHITDSDRQQLAKHIVQEQSRLRRTQQNLSPK